MHQSLTSLLGIHLLKVYFCSCRYKCGGAERSTKGTRAATETGALQRQALFLWALQQRFSSEAPAQQTRVVSSEAVSLQLLWQRFLQSHNTTKTWTVPPAESSSGEWPRQAASLWPVWQDLQSVAPTTSASGDSPFGEDATQMPDLWPHLYFF